MVGTASEWFTMVAEANAAANEHWPTVKDFWKSLEAQFGDVNPELTARAHLSKIAQGTRLVHEYSNEFNKISIRTGFNEEALIDKYYKGLNRNIAHRIFLRDEIPTHLVEAQAIASQIEDQEARFQRFTGTTKKSSKSGNTHGA